MDIHRVYRALGAGFRRRRMRRFERVFRPTARTRILDVGGTRAQWDLAQSRPRVTLLNLDARALGDAAPFAAVAASGLRLPYPDAAFDVAFCNSVIEHVGASDAQRALAAQLSRVARGLWVQTPARHFFVEPHLLTPFFHFLPRSWQRRLARNFTVWGWLTRPDTERARAMVDGTRLLSYREFAALFPDCEIRRERFLGWTKSYVAVRPSASDERARRPGSDGGRA
jgi:methyltransferase family protein